MKARGPKRREDAFQEPRFCLTLPPCGQTENWRIFRFDIMQQKLFFTFHHFEIYELKYKELAETNLWSWLHGGSQQGWHHPEIQVDMLSGVSGLHHRSAQARVQGRPPCVWLRCVNTQTAANARTQILK